MYPSTVSASPSSTVSLLNEEMSALQKISRLVHSVDELATSYTKTSDEIDALKEVKRHVKNELKSARDELDGLKLLDMKASDRKLLKADKRTAIQKLKRQLSRTRRGLEELERERERTFRKREETKRKMMRKMVEMVAGERRRPGAAGVAVRGVEDVAAVAKLVEWVRMDPGSEVEGGVVSARELEEITEAASRFNVQMKLGDNGDKS